MIQDNEEEKRIESVFYLFQTKINKIIAEKNEALQKKIKLNKKLNMQTELN